MQTAKGSALEAITNTAVGFGVNFTANWLLLPLFGFTALTLRSNIIIGLLYTVISIVRGYVLRRTFNRLKIFEAST